MGVNGKNCSEIWQKWADMSSSWAVTKCHVSTVRAHVELKVSHLLISRHWSGSLRIIISGFTLWRRYFTFLFNASSFIGNSKGVTTNPFFPFRSFSTGQNRRFFKPIKSCLCTVKSRYSNWLVSLLSAPKNRTSLAHIQVILEVFKVRKPEFCNVSHYTVVTHC